MKNFGIVFFLLVSFSAIANNPYHNYLLSKIELNQSEKFQLRTVSNPVKTSCGIPHFERPKGAVFCRMEDYLTVKTKIWFKIGVK